MKKIALSLAAVFLLSAPSAFAIENFSLNPFTGFKNCNPCKVEKVEKCKCKCKCKKEKVKCGCQVQKPKCNECQAQKPKCDECQAITGAAAPLPCPNCKRAFNEPPCPCKLGR